MSVVPYMKFYIGDYLGDTQHLTTLQHGAYLLLIMAYWQRRGPLPMDDEKLARIARCTPEEWMQCKIDALAFFEERGGMLYHHRIDKELGEVKEVSSKRRDAANRKWAKLESISCKSDANAEQMDCKSDANDMLSHIHSHSQNIKEEEKKPDKPAKHKLGEYSNILLSDAEQSRLIAELGQSFFDTVISFYSAWKKEKGKISKDDNLTIRRWVISAVKEKGLSMPVPIPEKKNDPPKLPICPVCGTTGKMMRQSFCPKCGYLLEPATMADLEAVAEYKAQWEAKGKA